MSVRRSRGVIGLMVTILTPIVLGACCAVGVVMTALHLPGTWLIVATALAYGWWTDWAELGVVTIAVLGGMAALGEAVEVLASVVTARRAGATSQAGWGALIGGFVGMLFLSFLVPIPLIGTMVGALVGCFGGALLAELAMKKRLAHGAKVGVFAAIGFVLGTVTKLALAMVMAALLFTSAMCTTEVGGAG